MKTNSQTFRWLGGRAGLPLAPMERPPRRAVRRGRFWPGETFANPTRHWELAEAVSEQPTPATNSAPITKSTS